MGGSSFAQGSLSPSRMSTWTFETASPWSTHYNTKGTLDVTDSTIRSMSSLTMANGGGNQSEATLNLTNSTLGGPRHGPRSDAPTSRTDL